MAYTFFFEPVLDNLRAKMKAAYALPDGHAIPEAGNQPIALDAAKLPMGLLECEPLPLEDAGQGLGAKAVVWVLTAHCWCVQATTANSDDTAAIRVRLTTLINAIYADRHLGGLASGLAARARVTMADWTGQGRTPPLGNDTGIGVACGYVSVEVTVAVGDV